MKKICSVLLILTLILSLTACKTPAAEVESGALAETPVEEQEPTKEEQAPESKEETQEPSQEVPEETDTTQPPENTAVEEPEMENRLVCAFRIYLKEDRLGYTLNDFSGLGAERLESYPNPSIYTLYGTYKSVEALENVMDSLFAREEVKNIELKYEAYRVEKGADATAYPSLERNYKNMKDCHLYDGRVGVRFLFEDKGYHHLLTLEDFPDISAEACYFVVYENGLSGYVNLIDDSEDALDKAVTQIQRMPCIETAEQYRDPKIEVE